MKQFQLAIPATLYVIVNAASKAHALKMAQSKQGETVEDASGFDGTMLEGCGISVGKADVDAVTEIED